MSSQLLIGDAALASEVHQAPTWVSKTQLMRFRKCAYAFWLIESGIVDAASIIGSAEMLAMEQGNQFEARVALQAKPLPEPLTFEEACRGDFVIHKVPLLRNHELRICGVPDRIDTANGLMIPVEVKYRSTIRPTDRLELAFYWLVLEPLRTRPGPAIGRVVILASEGFREVEIQLEQRDFDEVQGLLAALRSARQNGVGPDICDCEICFDRPEVRKLSDLLRIWGVGTTFARALVKAGIRSVRDLALCNPCLVLPATGLTNVSLETLRRWQHHAHALVSGNIIRFGHGILAPGPHIVLDLEYFPDGDIWLFGAEVCSSDSNYRIQLWADNAVERRAALRKLRRVISDHNEYPIITWAGRGADIPHLINVAKRYKCFDLVFALEERHLDLFYFAQKNLRFPTYGLALDSVAHFFGIRGRSPISGGFEALSLYSEYYSTKSAEKKERLKNELLEYNADDLHALRELVKRMSKICCEPKGPGLPKFNKKCLRLN